MNIILDVHIDDMEYQMNNKLNSSKNTLLKMAKTTPNPNQKRNDLWLSMIKADLDIIAARIAKKRRLMAIWDNIAKVVAENERLV